MKSTDIKNHKTSSSQTHNLEVLGLNLGCYLLKKSSIYEKLQVLFLLLMNFR